MTTFDQIWTTFLNNCKVSDIELPSTDEKIYECIKNAVMYFNNRMRTTVQCDTNLEELNEELDEDQLLILANYIRLVFLVNQKTYYINLWQPFSGDISLKNYNKQLTSLENEVVRQERVIDILIANAEVDFL